MPEGQLHLFAKSRATDPETSAEAAAGIEASGAAGHQRQLCYEAVVAQPGITAAEVAKRTGLERHAPSRRLPELRDAGMVRNAGSRICTATGHRSITWYPTERTTQ